MRVGSSCSLVAVRYALTAYTAKDGAIWPTIDFIRVGAALVLVKASIASKGRFSPSRLVGHRVG